MKRLSRSEAILRSLCGQLGPDDGQDPRKQKTQHSTKHPCRKTWQLCSQVQRALNFTLSEGAGSALLQSAYVRSVEPAPDATQLLVTVAVTDRVTAVELQQLQLELSRRQGRLRAAVAGAITRRKTPTLTFRVIPEMAGGCEPGGGRHE